MRRLYYLFALLLSFSAVKAQTTTDSIKAAVNGLFTAMRNADSTALAACFAPDAVLQTIAKDGVRTVPIAKFAGSVGRLPKHAADERIVFGNIQVDASLAAVWTPYKFYYQQQFSHCGVNSFQLVRLESGWKIQYIIDTRRKDGCVE